ncbi:hypothetical protein K2173_016848 [Erythroxylum novogranatense]|uniref:FAS1 domain-containing protein n=1 Tax=Erythroxylum novogranatense TaxID=1862640 RepID=A0AAV8SHL8_9ROSI|nr:hypothetical protein K2173_016848 [Erythroxylum novogranatense]
MTKQQTFFSLTLLLLLLHATKITSQSPAASPTKPPAPAPKASPVIPVNSPPPPPSAQSPAMVQPIVTKGPLNIIKVLNKAGNFAFFIRLIKSTQEDLQLFSQLNSSRDGVTIFAPTNGAFSAFIKSGTLNSLSDQQKRELVHNPIRTLAGSGARFPLNVITSDSSVNITTGLTNTTVDNVLLPLDIFAPKPPAPAPAPLKKKSEGAKSPDVPKVTTSGAESCVVHKNLVIFGVGIVAAIFCL